MAGKRKSGHKKSSLEKILLATAVLELITASVQLMKELTG